ncbi:hypothetical protein EDD15DRAFT_1467898 [Pisolithus albus]|nr:hypothetical protein EDD15DRAFT_1467898 [Pisolithus albus]
MLHDRDYRQDTVMIQSTYYQSPEGSLEDMVSSTSCTASQENKRPDGQWEKWTLLSPVVPAENFSRRLGSFRPLVYLTHRAAIDSCGTGWSSSTGRSGPQAAICFNCLVLGDTPGRIFTLVIFGSKTVSTLREAIKNKKQHAFHSVDADQSSLHRASPQRRRTRGANNPMPRVNDFVTSKQLSKWDQFISWGVRTCDPSDQRLAPAKSAHLVPCIDASLQVPVATETEGLMQTTSAGEERKQLHAKRWVGIYSLVNLEHGSEEEPSFPWWVGLTVLTSASALGIRIKFAFLLTQLIRLFESQM